jgi:hypothetical protein
MAKKIRKTPEQLAQAMKEILKGKEENPNGKDAFEKALKEAVRPKPRALKRPRT